MNERPNLPQRLLVPDNARVEDLVHEAPTPEQVPGPERTFLSYGLWNDAFSDALVATGVPYALLAFLPYESPNTAVVGVGLVAAGGFLKFLKHGVRTLDASLGGEIAEPFFTDYRKIFSYDPCKE